LTVHAEPGAGHSPDAADGAQHGYSNGLLSGGVTGRILRLAIGLTVGLLAGWYVLRDTQLDEVWRLLASTAPLPLALSLLLVAMTQPVKALRWQAIAGGAVALPLGRSLRGLLIGQALNLLMPFRAGDVARAYLVGRQVSQGTVFTFYTVLAEKALDMVMLLASLVLLLAWGPWPEWLSRPGIAAAVGAIVVMAAGLVGAWIWQQRSALLESRPVAGLRRRIEQHLIVPAGVLAQGLAAARHDGRLMWMVVWSVVTWVLGWATNVAVFWALGLSVHWTAALLILVAIYAGVVVPAPPARVGLWHFLVVLVLTSYGIAQSPAMACGVLLHLVVVGPLLLAGAGAAWIKT
jgi:uncharacterized protein (TIRG00374 family)